MASIFLYSQNQGRCVELKVPEASPSDLAQLTGVLPRNVSGLSFTQPDFVAGSQGKVRVHSVSSPRHVAQHLGVLGDRMLQASQTLAALRFYDLALRIGAEAPLQMKRAEALFNLGRVEEARREVENILRRDLKNGEAYFLRGKIALHQERYAEAVRYFGNAEYHFSKEPEKRQLAGVYLRFSKIYQDRDQLHLRDLSPSDYVVAIQQLQARSELLRQELQGFSNPHAEALALHLDALENLFSNWLRELSV